VQFAGNSIEQFEAGVKLISESRLPGAGKMVVREILGRATFQLRAAQLLSGDESHPHIYRPS
jgi:hypothetical protein